MRKGVYLLSIKLAKPTRIKVGKLGTFKFPKGRYIYTGSAMCGLERRLERHFRKSKKPHWHIDYLLKHAKIEWALVVETESRVECELNRLVLSLPEAKVVVKGFGSSDCNCPSHLVYTGERGERLELKGGEVICPRPQPRRQAQRRRAEPARRRRVSEAL